MEGTKCQPLLRNISFFQQLQFELTGSRGKGFVVLFMKHDSLSIKGIFIASDSGVQINISSSENLNSTLKIQIDKMIDISSNHLVTIPGAMELTSFQKEVKSIFIESSQDVFVTSITDRHRTSGSTANIPLNKCQRVSRCVIVSKNIGSQ